MAKNKVGYASSLVNNKAEDILQPDQLARCIYSQNWHTTSFASLLTSLSASRSDTMKPTLLTVYQAVLWNMTDYVKKENNL